MNIWYIDPRYDEISRNSILFHQVLRYRYPKSMTFQSFVDTLKELNTTVFIAGTQIAAFGLLPDPACVVLKTRGINYAQITGVIKNKKEIVMGIVCGPDLELIKQTVLLYTSTFNESLGQTRH